MPARPRVAIVGVGLIGGSIGLALRERGLAEEVVGIGRRMVSLEKAATFGTIDRGTTNLAEGVTGVDLAIVATPVAAIVDAVRSVAHAAPQASITDAGSTKAEICRAVRRPAKGESSASAVGSGRFIGSH